MRIVSLEAALVFSCICAGVACAPPPSAEDGAPITLVSYERGPDGTVVSRSQAITYQQYLGIHARRARGAASGDVAVSQSALAYLGDSTTVGTLPAACSDDRTTWIYNVANGWAVGGVVGSGLVIGCIGAGLSGDWTGTIDPLDQVALPCTGAYQFNHFPDDTCRWSHALQSLWSSNTYHVLVTRTCLGGPCVNTGSIAPWQVVNIGSGIWSSITHW
jgi:hypothetical protein